jgi:hypothetical protein
LRGGIESPKRFKKNYPKKN